MSGKTAPWSGDLLRRAELSRRLIEVVRTHTSGAVIGIEGDFGSGKTYFLTNFADELDSEGLTHVYFNAWESDFAENPLLVLMGQIFESLYDLVPQDGELERFKSAAKRLGPILLRVGAKALLRAGGDDLDKLLGPLDEEVDDVFANPDSKFTHVSLSKARQALRDVLEAAKQSSPQAFPFVVLVDELDRANPRWVVTFLEAIKHLFGHNDIVFLIAIDHKNLVALLKHEFGDGYNVDEYLSKFFTYSISIQEASADRSFLRSQLVKSNLIADKVLIDNDNWARGIGGVVSACMFGLGGGSGRLRRIQRCAERLAVCLRSSQAIGWAALVGGIVALYHSDRAMFVRYTAGLQSHADLQAFFGLQRSEKDRRICVWMIACAIPSADWARREVSVRAALDESVSKEVAGHFSTSEFFELASDESAVQMCMEQIGWLLNQPLTSGTR